MLDLNFDFNQKTILGSTEDTSVKFFDMLNDFAEDGKISIYQALVEFQIGYKKPIEEHIIRYVHDRVKLRAQAEQVLADLQHIVSTHDFVKCHEPSYQNLRTYIVSVVQTTLMAEAIAFNQAQARRRDAN